MDESVGLVEQSDEVHECKASTANIPVKKFVVGVGSALVAGLLMWCALSMRPEGRAAPNRSMLEWTGKSCAKTPGFQSCLNDNYADWTGFNNCAKPSPKSCYETCSNVGKKLSYSNYPASEKHLYSSEMSSVKSGEHHYCRVFGKAEETELMCTKIMMKRLPDERSLWACTKGAKNDLERCVGGSQTADQFQDCIGGGEAAFDKYSTQKRQEVKNLCTDAAKIMSRSAIPKNRDWTTEFTSVQKAINGAFPFKDPATAERLCTNLKEKFGQQNAGQKNEEVKNLCKDAAEIMSRSGIPKAREWTAEGIPKTPEWTTELTSVQKAIKGEFPFNDPATAERLCTNLKEKFGQQNAGQKNEEVKNMCKDAAEIMSRSGIPKNREWTTEFTSVQKAIHGAFPFKDPATAERLCTNLKEKFGQQNAGQKNDEVKNLCKYAAAIMSRSLMSRSGMPKNRDWDTEFTSVQKAINGAFPFNNPATAERLCTNLKEKYDQDRV